MWTIYTNYGYFQSPKLKKLLKEMAKYYSEQENAPCVDQITDIFYTNKKGVCCEKSQKAIDFFQSECDLLCKEYTQQEKEERMHGEELLLDYYGNLI